MMAWMSHNQLKMYQGEEDALFYNKHIIPLHYSPLKLAGFYFN